MKTDYTPMRLMKAVKCPICGKDVEFYEKEKLPPSFPFCSRRCKLIDLGKWLDEEYKTSEPISEERIPVDDGS